MTNYAFIGDIHSQNELLDRALEHCANVEAIPILLGDIFDSHHPNHGCALRTLELVKEAQNTLGAIVLHSNHQDKLIRHLKGNKVRISADFARTLEDLKEVEPCGLQSWLESLPYGVVLNYGETQYRVAHAYFSDKVLVKNSPGMHLIHNVPKAARNTFLYGPTRKENGQRSRVAWWGEENDQRFRRVSGHYHTIFESQTSLVLDGECGGNARGTVNPFNGCLPLYETQTQTLRQFCRVF